MISLSFSGRKLSSGAETTLSRLSHKSVKTPKANLSRKLENEFNKMLLNGERRRIKSANEYRILSTSSSSSDGGSDAEDELRIDSILKQSRTHLETIEAIKNRREFLRSEDYVSNCRQLWPRFPNHAQLSLLRTKSLQLRGTASAVWRRFSTVRLVQFALFVAVMIIFEVSSLSYVRRMFFMHTL